ncbi:hypothetical protein ACS2R8_27315, partial [Bacillus cereus group sp. BC6]
GVADEKLSTASSMLVKARFDQPLFLFENEFAIN